MQENCIIYGLKRERGQKIQGINQRSVRVSKIRGGVFGKQNPRRGFREAKSKEGFSGSKIRGGVLGEQNQRKEFGKQNSRRVFSGSKIRGGLFGKQIPRRGFREAKTVHRKLCTENSAPKTGSKKLCTEKRAPKTVHQKLSSKLCLRDRGRLKQGAKKW